MEMSDNTPKEVLSEIYAVDMDFPLAIRLLKIEQDKNETQHETLSKATCKN